MVAADQSDAIWIAHFQAQEKKERLERVEAAVDKIAHEEVVGVGNIAADSEEFHEVVKLAVYVTTYRHGRIDCNNVSLFYQQLACHVT